MQLHRGGSFCVKTYGATQSGLRQPRAGERTNEGTSPASLRSLSVLAGQNPNCTSRALGFPAGPGRVSVARVPRWPAEGAACHVVSAAGLGGLGAREFGLSGGWLQAACLFFSLSK